MPTTAEKRRLVYYYYMASRDRKYSNSKKAHAAFPFVPLTPREIFAALKSKTLKSSG